MKKTTIVIFTYKRAILLDVVLKFLFKNFKDISYPVHIIYNHDDSHAASYKILFKYWRKRGVKIYKREKISLLKAPIHLLIRPLNFLWLLRWPDILRNFNNFKSILENIVKKSKNDFITLVTDDQIFFRSTKITDEIKMALKLNNRSFYRFISGKFFKDDHKLDKSIKILNLTSKYFSWSCEDKYAAASWKYRFTVDGTIYLKEDLLELIEPFIYHNPVTLEGIGLWESRFRRFFRIGHSAVLRTSAHYQINNVQKLVINQCSSFDSDFLMKKYLQGYRLKINPKEFLDIKYNILPKKIHLIHNKSNKRIIIKENY